MTNSQLALGLVLFILPILAILLFWYAATHAPVVKYYCGFCNRAWGHYPNGRLYHQAVERADRFDYWPLLCPHCHLEQRERQLRESSREGLNAASHTMFHARHDAANDGFPEVNRIF